MLLLSLLHLRKTYMPYYNIENRKIRKMTYLDGNRQRKTKRVKEGFGTDFRSDIGQNSGDFLVRHGVPLGQITHRRRKLTVRSAELCNDNLGSL